MDAGLSQERRASLQGMKFRKEVSCIFTILGAAIISCSLFTRGAQNMPIPGYTLTVTGTILESTPTTSPETATVPATKPFTPVLIPTRVILVTPSPNQTQADLTLPTTEEGIIETMIPATTVIPSPTAASFALDGWCIPWNTGFTKAEVTQVIDGVSIIVSIEQQPFTVRYIGIDVPEPGGNPETWNAALEKNRLLVEGKSVLLVKDKTDRDGEGRLPRYVVADSTFVNLKLLEDGNVVASSMPPDTSCDVLFQTAERIAIAKSLGLYAASPTPTRTLIPPTSTPAATGEIEISLIQFDGRSWQDPNEFVEIHSMDTQPISLKGWTLRDAKNHVFTFPDFVIYPDNYCRIYTNEYHPGSCGFSYFSLSPMWDDDGDCGYLKDATGKLIDEYCYP